MSKVTTFARAGREAEVPAGDDPAGEAREHRLHGLRRAAAAASIRPPFDFMIETGPEKPRAASPASSSPARRRDDGREVGVDDGRRRALVLAPDRRRRGARPTRGRPGTAASRNAARRRSCAGFGVREEQADGDRDVAAAPSSSRPSRAADSLELGVGRAP